MTEVEQPPQNGIDLSAADEDDSSKARPADIEQDMREMERRKRVEAIMGSKLFREELERIVDAARESGSAGGILQQLSDIVGLPVSRVGNVFKASNCMLPINDIRGVESMGYAKGEKILRCKLAATFRLLDLYGWTQGLGAQITARLKVDQEYFLVNPYGLLYHEITASSLNKVDMQGHIVEQGTTNFGVNKSHFVLHSAVHAARPDIRCAIYIGCSPVVAISSLKTGLLPLTKDACVLGEITSHPYTGSLLDSEERDKLVRNLGPNSKVMLLTNHGALCCGETIEEAFFAACHIVQACETQLKLLPVGLDNLVLIPEESRKVIYDQSRRPPEDLEKKFAAVSTTEDGAPQQKEEGGNTVKVVGAAPKWRVGGAEFEALMRMLDNAGYRTGYIYRHPLIKSDPPKPKNDVELPPAVSSLGYLLEEEELFRQGIWKKGDLRKGGDRSRWLNSPNVYQKVEVLETGTPDPKKITKWVAEGSPTHSTPVRIEDPLQFVPAGTNPKEFKRLQQQIKDNRRADKISAGPQSHILEGVTWDEANRIKDATVSSAGDHVVLMGAASKGIIQRGYQHNATVYKAPYAKNPFDNVTDDELNEYKRTVERKKKSIHGEYTDTDFSESEPLSSLQTSGAQQTKQNTTTTTAAVSQSEPEDISEHQVMRIETQQAPIPSQAEVVLSDATLSFLNGERSHSAVNQKPPTGRDIQDNYFQAQDFAHAKERDSFTSGKAEGRNTKAVCNLNSKYYVEEADDTEDDSDSLSNKENAYCGDVNVLHQSHASLIAEMKSDSRFQRQKEKYKSSSPLSPRSLKKCTEKRGEGNNDNDDDDDDDDDDDNDTNTHEDSERRGGVVIADYNGEVSASSYYTANENCNSHLSKNSTLTTSHSLHAVPFAQFCAIAPPVLPCFPHAFATIAPPRNVECCAFYYEPLHPCLEAFSGGFDKCSSDQNSECETPYKKSIFCCTPTVCEGIFKTLQQPQRDDNDLIYNIPFSPSSSVRRTRADSPYKQPPNSPCGDERSRSGRPNVSGSQSPYRTVSHFGFKSPVREPKPEHKHIPLPIASTYVPPQEPKKYVAVSKSVSYEEIFSSPRYVDLCENCFEQVVRHKPELVQTRMRLRNIADAAAEPIVDVPCVPPCALPAVPARSSNQESLSVTPDEEDEDQCNAGDEYEYVGGDSLSESSEAVLPFSQQLEPLIEVLEEDEEEGLENEGQPGKSVEQSASASSFLDKIMRMNYSEESSNTNFLQTPHTFSSNISLELDEGKADTDKSDAPPVNETKGDGNAAALAVVKTEHSAGNQTSEKSEPHALTDSDTDNNNNNNVEVHVSVTEIWEFGDWCTEQFRVQPNQVDRGGFHSGSPAGSSQNQASDSDGAAQPAPQRALMSRDERNQRKSEFQELWEDHVAYFNGRDGGHSTLSDTESAIDGRNEKQEEIPQEEIQPSESKDTQESAEETESGKPQRKSVSELEVDETTSAQEIFIGRSLIKKPSTHVMSTTQKEPLEVGEVLVEDKAETSKVTKKPVPVKRTNKLALAKNARKRSNQKEEPFPQDQTFFRAPSETELSAVVSPRCGVHSKTDNLPDTTRERHLEDTQRRDLTEDALEFEDLIAEAETEAEDDQLNKHINELLHSVESMLIEEQSKDVSEEGQIEEELDKDENEGVGEEELLKPAEGIYPTPPDVPEVDVSEFDEVELRILQKIESNHLRQAESIFHQIDHSIRNKLTPSKLNLLIQQQKQGNTVDRFGASTSSKQQTLTAKSSCEDSKALLLTKKDAGELSPAQTTDANANVNAFPVQVGCSYVVLNPTQTLPPKPQISSPVTQSTVRAEDTPPIQPGCSYIVLDAAHTFPQNQYERNNHRRRSRSLHTTREEDYFPLALPPKYKLPAANESPRQDTPPYSARSTGAVESFCSPSSTSTASKRNFILENIRNASKSKPRYKVKRLRDGSNNLSGSKTPRHANVIHSSTSLASTDSNGDDSVFSFQSKLVRGSQRFWISLASSARERCQCTPTSVQKSRKNLSKSDSDYPSGSCLCAFDDSDVEGAVGITDDYATAPLQNVSSTTTFTVVDDEASTSLSLNPTTTTSNATPDVEGQIKELCEQIEQIQPRLETYKRKLQNYGEKVSRCSRNVDECIEVQIEIAEDQRQLRENVLLAQYVEKKACEVETYSLSETED